MLKKCLIVSLLVGGCAAIASAQDAKTALGSVSKSLGADTLKTVHNFGHRFRLRARAESQRQRTVAEVHREELHAGHRFRR